MLALDKAIEEETIKRILIEMGETDLSDLRERGWERLCKKLEEKIGPTPS